jgi:hypothetical protein
MRLSQRSGGFGRALVLAACVAALQLSPAPARADYPFPFVQITCAPDLHYVSVRRLIVENAAGYNFIHLIRGRAATQTQNEQRNQIFTSRSLAEHPVACDIPAAMTRSGPREAVSVTVGAKVDPPSKDATAEGADEVTVDSAGKRLAAISMGLKYQASGVDSIELYANGVGLTVRTCSFDEGSDTQLTCKSRDLPPPK